MCTSSQFFETSRNTKHATELLVRHLFSIVTILNGNYIPTSPAAFWHGSGKRSICQMRNAWRRAQIKLRPMGSTTVIPNSDQYLFYSCAGTNENESSTDRPNMLA
ncbi:hypothetical protein TWF694_004242 [Orbilia ellipsospora]|uniref:Uncharacterized protein n=1 Tax=Orbilia ellipsospora TaxID=2528407 RepID=A0AAV9X3H6_9PEZI